jgi:hypothetical protein
MATKKDTKESPKVVEAPKVVETMEAVEDVSPQELQELENELKAKKEENDPKSAALAAQSGQLRTIEEIIEDLSKPVHPKYLRKLQFGAAKGATYIPWMFVEKYLDHFAAGWSTSSEGFSTPIGTCIVTHLTIPTINGPVTRAGHGFEAHQTTNNQGVTKDTGFGGAPVVASRQAFKRASVSFGLGRDLYPV